MIFLRAIKDWVYCPDRFYFFTGADSTNTLEAEEELERSGFTVSRYDIYNHDRDIRQRIVCKYNQHLIFTYSFNPRLTIGLGKCSVLKRLHVRFVLWMSGVKGRLWYAE